MKDGKIKTKDLCDKCKYSFWEWCDGKDCNDCHMVIISEGGVDKCACCTVKYNTPCPYFEEREDKHD